MTCIIVRIHAHETGAPSPQAFALRTVLNRLRDTALGPASRMGHILSDRTSPGLTLLRSAYRCPGLRGHWRGRDDGSVARAPKCIDEMSDESLPARRQASRPLGVEGRRRALRGQDILALDLSQPIGVAAGRGDRGPDEAHQATSPLGGYAVSNLAPSTLAAALSKAHSGCSRAWPASAACRQSAKSALLRAYCATATSTALSDSKPSSNDPAAGGGTRNARPAPGLAAGAAAGHTRGLAPAPAM